MHIGFLTPEYPHPELSRAGGLGTSIKNLAMGLVKNEVNVSVFVIGQSRNVNYDDSGIKVISLAKKKHITFNWYFERKRIQKIINQYVKTEGIQLIEAPDWTGISAFMKFNVPLIIRLNGSDGFFCHLDGRSQKKKNYFLEHKALTNADAIVSVSTFTGKLTKQVFKLKHDIKTIHNSIDIDAFKPIDVEIYEDQLLYFGTIIRKKGILELAEAFNLVVEKVPKSKLLLIGKDAIDVFEKTSTVRLFFDKLSSKAKANVTYLTEVPYHEIKKHIAEAQIIVLPSFAEAFPMTWLETLALEKPLVSSNIGWANELMVNNSTGFTVDPKNHEAFASKIIELLKNSDLCKAFGKAGRLRVVEKFSVQKITNQNIEFYKYVINR